MIEPSPPDRVPSGAQLALTISAVVLALGAFALVQLGLNQDLGTHLPQYGLVFVIGYSVAYLFIRWLAPASEPSFFPAAGLLVGIGFAMIYRLQSGQAAEQAGWLCVGLLAFALTLFLVRDL